MTPTIYLSLTESDFRTIFWLLIVSNILCLCFAGILRSVYYAFLRYLDRKIFDKKRRDRWINEFERRAAENEEKRRLREQS